jgi:aminoglycoside phosphotransferase (APT) family kinase protein
VPATNVGVLDHTDPLYEILTDRVYPGTKHPVFRVARLSRHGLVYRYTEATTRSAVVGKFFRLTEPDEGKLARIKGEYLNLVRLRSLGFAARPYSVVKPLCREERIGLAVAEEFVQGKDLDHYLRRAAWGADRRGLKRSLSLLAAFLYTLHERSAGSRVTCREDAAVYFRKIVAKLRRQTVLDAEEAATCLALSEKWLDMPFMAAQEVTVHGDATPTNFIFPDDGDVVAIDLERMRRSDRVLDVGMVCGELKHAFLWRTGDPYASEPFIRRFLRQYSRGFPSPDEAFREITRRVPFYMALTELRIARNTWLNWEYRKRLAREAQECLRWGLRNAREALWYPEA